MTLREAMRDRPQAPFCSMCDREVQCHEDAAAVVCARCVHGAISKTPTDKTGRPCVAPKEGPL